MNEEQIEQSEQMEAIEHVHDHNERQLTKRERREARKQEQRDQNEARIRSQKMKNRLAGLVLITVVIAFGYLFFISRPEPLLEKTLGDLGNQHIETPSTPHKQYNSSPPTSGPHVPNITNWGTHKEEIADEILVHNLEDGGVIIQYHPEKVLEEQVNELEDIMNSSRRKHVVLVPYSKMDHKIALTAWTKLLVLDFVDKEKILRFIKKYEGIDHHVAK